VDIRLAKSDWGENKKLGLVISKKAYMCTNAGMPKKGKTVLQVVAPSARSQGPKKDLVIDRNFTQICTKTSILQGGETWARKRFVSGQRYRTREKKLCPLLCKKKVLVLPPQPRSPKKGGLDLGEGRGLWPKEKIVRTKIQRKKRGKSTGKAGWCSRGKMKNGQMCTAEIGSETRNLLQQLGMCPSCMRSP